MTKLQTFRCPVELADMLNQQKNGKTKTQIIIEALRESLLRNSGVNVGEKKKSTVSNFTGVNGALATHN